MMRQRFGQLCAPALAAAIMAAAPASAAPAAAPAPAQAPATLSLLTPETAVGQWDIALSGAANGCRLALRGEAMHGGFFLGMPAGCRHALPILLNVTSWTLPGDNHIDFADAYGNLVLDFATGADGRLTAAGPRGETYRLTFVAAAPAPPTNQPPAAEQRAAADAAAAPVVRPRAALRPVDVAGRYAVLRSGGRDTGCMVTLDISGKAFLAPACRDQGIVIFDPTGWRLVAGRLVLKARKGHTAQLDQQPDGAFLKDPKDGAALSLKKF